MTHGNGQRIGTAPCTCGCSVTNTHPHRPQSRCDSRNSLPEAAAANSPPSSTVAVRTGLVNAFIERDVGAVQSIQHERADHIRGIHQRFRASRARIPTASMPAFIDQRNCFLASSVSGLISARRKPSAPEVNLP